MRARLTSYADVFTICQYDAVRMGREEEPVEPAEARPELRGRVIKSDLARIDKLRDDDIDYSDIPELGDEVFAKPLAPWPPKKETITIRVDSDVLG